MFLRRVTKGRKKFMNVFVKDHQRKKEVQECFEKDYQRKKDAHESFLRRVTKG
jgi:hypothetical protein